jgi:hypothetical protein
MIPSSKLKKAMRDIGAKKGPFVFFALLQRANAVGGDWDLVVSAPWLEEYDLKGLRQFTKLLAKSIGEKSLVQLARIAVLPPTDPALREIVSRMALDEGEVRVERRTLFGQEIDDGIIFRAKRAA